MLYVMLWFGMTNEDLMIGNDTEMLWYWISIQCYAMVYVVQDMLELTVPPNGSQGLTIRT